MSALRWGLIGASDIAATRLIPAMRRLGQAPLAVLSSSAERADAFAHTHGIPRAYTDLEQLLDQGDIDAVYISTTNELHLSQTLAAADAGKHVLCEKPLALSVSDAWAMVDACDGAGVVLATNHHLPGAGTHRRVAQLVRDGAIGRPLAVRVFHAVELPERLRGWRLSDASRGGGVILDITCHDAAALRAILEREAVEATAIAVRQGPWDAAVDDAVMSVIRFEDDVLVQTHDAFTIAHAATGLQVHGSDGSIVATDVMSQDPIGEVVVHRHGHEQVVESIDRSDLYDTALSAFAGAVDGTRRPLVDGIDGARAMAIALAVKEAADTGRAVRIESQPRTASPTDW
jgi:1,5-anhydro-D-fructose reductase (1,5-anhydro-D-mannitol-forming)